MFRQQVKRILLPTSLKASRLPIGIGRGIAMEIDFQHQLKTYFGLYEVELNSHLRRLCRGAVTCFDVGASVGYDTLVMAKLSGGNVVAFDFDDAVMIRFKSNLALNPDLRDRIQLIRQRVNDGASGGRSLDSFIDEGLTIPDLIKIDVEGSELDVLAGARRTLAKRGPGLLVEVHAVDLEEACMAMLVEIGYRPLVVERRKWLAEQRPIPHNRWLVAYSPHGDSGLPQGGE